MVNWDPEAQTVLSNEEVIYSTENSKLHKVRYKIAGTDEYIVIATTRPETIMGDAAIAVHPEDPRYTHLKDAKAIVPMVDREIPIIFDDYVDLEFGTGALKVTPAHDVNDYEIGKRHNLETINIFHPDGRLNENAKVFIGEDRFVARKSAVKLLDEIGALVEVEDYQNNVGRSERTRAIVEPRLSLQWYVDMKKLVKPALDSVENDIVEFFPKNQKNLYRHWMENIRDWCISRQLWWGHRIPAYYIEDQVFVAESIEEAIRLAEAQMGRSVKAEELKQDEDVLDTWFSSWLWPISVFDGFDSKEEIDYYYPTSVLVTGWDIIFLWVARMIMAGYEWKNEKPFQHVYFTGMVRDKKGRKMSKSLGNSPDALKLIEEYSADGVRFGMMNSSPAGGDLLFDEKLCGQGKNFINKIWNALKLIKSFDIDKNKVASAKNKVAIQWIKNEMSRTLKQVEKDFTSYRLSEALTTLYSFIWTEFCSWFLEMIKPEYGGTIDQETVTETLGIFGDMMVMLHPFMPFLTEEVYHLLKEQETDCCVSKYPTLPEADEVFLNEIAELKTLISSTRDVRNKAQLKKSLKVDLCYTNDNALFSKDNKEAYISILKQLATIENVTILEGDDAHLTAYLSGTSKYFIDLPLELDADEELKKIEDEIVYLNGFIKSISKKLSNERFVNNAPAVVVDKERKKLSDAEARIKILEENKAKYQ
jgi:valyl-tRNA synthetase